MKAQVFYSYDDAATHLDTLQEEGKQGFMMTHRHPNGEFFYATVKWGSVGGML